MRANQPLSGLRTNIHAANRSVLSNKVPALVAGETRVLRSRSNGSNGGPHTRHYIGTGKEVVLVGTRPTELSCIGNEDAKFDLLGQGRLSDASFVTLGIRMGLFTAADVATEAQLAALRPVHGAFIEANTGIRTMTPANIGWNPADFRNGQKSPLAIDFGGPLPTGWTWTALGLRPKELGVKGNNLVQEVFLRALVRAGFHAKLDPLETAFSGRQVALHMGTGIGNYDQTEALVQQTFAGARVGPKILADSLASTPLGYLSPRLGNLGQIKTHVGACESIMGAIADAYLGLKFGRKELAVAGGYETPMQPSSFTGFQQATALIENAEVVDNVRRMVEEGALPADVYEPILRMVEERGHVFDLPIMLTRLASTPYSKWRSGFVMSEGGGAGVFTTLDNAIRLGLPIQAILAGVGANVPDGTESRDNSIAALGDGLGSAFREAVRDGWMNYLDLHADGGRWAVERIGACVGHGTSTTLNGFGERRAMHRLQEELGRPEGDRLFMVGDKGLQGHRVGGNFPTLMSYIFETRTVPPSWNYLQAGYEPTGRRGSFGAALDELFPLTAVVGKAGVGGGQAVPLNLREKPYVAVNGAGFGRNNTVLLFRQFSIEDVVLGDRERRDYFSRLAERTERSNDLLYQIDRGTETYYAS